METEVLRETLETLGVKSFDGEILYPFFPEGGRYTIGNVHYVLENEELVPAGLTEFAKDKSFGYHSSSLCEYCEEKSGGKIRAGDVVCITLEDLRCGSADAVEEKLMQVYDFNKVIVNSTCYADVKVFTAGFLKAVSSRKRVYLPQRGSSSENFGKCE